MSTATLNREERQVLRSQIARAEKLSDTFLLCRLVGHSWARILPDRNPLFGRLVVWQCDRCTTKRDDLLRPDDGALLHRGYRYPEGYLTKRTGKTSSQRGGRMFSTGALRVALLRRDDMADAEAS